MTAPANTLNFLIIGAQKSATTTLFDYLQEHAAIRMPASKEAPFFTGDHCTSDSWAEFSDKHFAGAEAGQLLGKATPQYMADPQTAQRIHGLFPRVKLIAILRDPIDRCWSHYMMDKRRETESRPFDAVIDTKLQAAELDAARTLPVPLHEAGYTAESDFYITWSEYGRILSRYLQFFPRDQLLLLSMTELQTNPQTLVDRIMRFLELEAGFVPTSLGAVAHRGGGQPIVSRKLRQRIIANPAVNAMWSAVPDLHKQNIRYWFDQKNVRLKAANDDRRFSVATEKLLREHFAADLKVLVERTGFETEWLGDYLEA